MSKENIQHNGVNYKWPEKPVVVVCIDGGDPEYFETGVQDGIIPNTENFIKLVFTPSLKVPCPVSLVQIICLLLLEASL